ncbi:MAG: PAS domain S-box protein [Syntrophales bacterium]|nr:PAS domain S-box protein [Syntrophales bacterium]
METEKSLKKELLIENEILRAREERYLHLIDGTNDGIYELDTDGYFTFVNKTISDRTGIPQEAFRGLHYCELIMPEDHELAQRNFEKIVQGETLPPYEIRGRTLGGRLMTLEVNASPIYGGRSVIGVMGIIRDVTERNLAVAALRKSQERLRRITSIMVDLVAQIDLQMVLQYITPNVEWILGFRVEDGLGKSALEFIHPDDHTLAAESLQRVLRSGNLEIELRIRHSDGRYIWMELLGNVLIGDDRKLAGVIISCRNVTNRRRAEEKIRLLHQELEKRVTDRTAQLEAAHRDLGVESADRMRAEDELRESERKYKELVDFLPIPVFEMDQHAYIISGNPAVHELFGVTPEDVENGLNAYRLIIPEEVEKAKQTVMKRFAGEKEIGTEFTGVRKDGSRFPMIIYGSPIIRRGRPVGLRGAIIDLTERKKAEESLRKSSASLADAQRIAHIGNWEWDIRTGETSWSDEIYRILGVARDSFGRRYEDLLDLIHPEDRAVVKGAVNRAVHTGAPAENSYRISRADGSIAEIAERIEAIPGGDGRTAKLLGIIQDVTERKKADKKLQKAKDALLQAEKLASIGLLSSGVAHEILNPINIIYMTLQVLQMSEDLSHEAHTEIAIAIEQVNRIVSITKDLGRFARTAKMDKERLDLNEIVRNALAQLGAQFKFSGIRTETGFASGLPSIKLSKEGIEQVLFNLFSNAVCAMENSGTKILKVETEKANSEGKDFARVRISDTGCGIKEENLPRIFEPFFTTKEPGKGIGLGLSISYGIVRDHGGRIWAEHRNGGGAAVIFELPIG